MKQCKFCKSSIDETATKCPVCKEWQSQWVPGAPRRNLLITLILGVALYYGLATFLFRIAKSSIDNSLSPLSFQLISSEKSALSDSLDVLGEVQALEDSNSSSMTAVEVTFYNKENKFIDMSTTYLRGPFKKGNTLPFKVKFGNCPTGLKRAFEKYDHYKIRIEGENKKL